MLVNFPACSVLSHSIDDDDDISKVSLQCHVLEMKNFYRVRPHGSIVFMTNLLDLGCGDLQH